MATTLLAQQPNARQPHIGYVYPAGGQQGKSFEVTLGGQFLEGAGGVRISQKGVEAEVIEHIKPMTAAQMLLLRDELKELQEKRSAARSATRSATAPAWTDADQAAVEEIQKKLAMFVRRPSSAAIAEVVRLKVTIAKDAEPGERSLRLLTNAGLTNPLVFHVGQFAEVSEKPTSNAGQPTAAVAGDEATISLPAIINGQILAGGVDRYRFHARRGQRIVVAVSARGLIPYLPDAVPGWFQATVALYAPGGEELAFSDDFRFSPDPVLYRVMPKDGEYAIAIRDSIYRGREDFVYRITIGELPYVTGIFPLGGQAGTHAAAEVLGYNLPSDRLTRDLSDAAPGMTELTAHKGVWLSNRVPFAVDTLNECFETEPNDGSENAQAIALPLIVNGRIGKGGDQDVFRVEGRAGDEIVAEVAARRLNSPIDATLRLTDATGRQMAFSDDREDKGAGLVTHHADPVIRAKLPADGAYFLHLGDAQGKGGLEYAYRLRISAPRPDFALRVAPSAINLRAGVPTSLTVCVLRQDGFAGEIELALTDAPAGVVLKGGRVPAGKDEVKVTITAPGARPGETLSCSIIGRATIGGRVLEHRAEPADDMMQAFIYRHLVCTDELAIGFVGRGGRGQAFSQVAAEAKKKNAK